MTAAWLTMSLAILLSLGACAKRTTDDLPDLRLGRDECSECGMSILDEHSSAAILVDSDRRRDYMLFDDIGCMLDTLRRADVDGAVIRALVHDHASGRWIDADAAMYVVTTSASLRTPMGSGIAAFADRAGAEAGVKQFGGDIVDSVTLAARRAARIDAARKDPAG